MMPERGHEEHGSLTPFQFTSIVAGTIIGVGVLVLPRLLTETAGHSAPLSMIVGTLIALATVPVWVKIAAIFPGMTSADFASDLIGTIPGWAFHIGFGLLLATAAAMVAREFGEVVITAVLPETPLEVTTLIMLGLATLFVRYDLQTVGRTYEILFPLIVFPGISIAILSLKNANLLYLLPIWDGSIDAFTVGVTFAVASLEGMLILPMIIPSINRPDQVTKAALWAVGISGFVHTLVVGATLAVFNVNEMQKLLWPTLEVMKTTSLPGNVVERIEPVFLGIWVAAVFTTISGWFYAVVIKVAKLLRLQDHKTIVPFLAPLLYLIALQPDNIVALYAFLRDLVRFGLIYMLPVPLLLYLVGRLRRLKERSP